MFVSNFAHLNCQFQFLKAHVFDVDQIFEEVALGVDLTQGGLDADVQLLEFTFSADKGLHLAQIFDFVNDYQTVRLYFGQQLRVQLFHGFVDPLKYHHKYISQQIILGNELGQLDKIHPIDYLLF